MHTTFVRLSVTLLLALSACAHGRGLQAPTCTNEPAETAAPLGPEPAPAVTADTSLAEAPQPVFLRENGDPYPLLETRDAEWKGLEVDRAYAQKQ